MACLEREFFQEPDDMRNQMTWERELLQLAILVEATSWGRYILDHQVECASMLPQEEGGLYSLCCFGMKLCLLLGEEDDHMAFIG